MDGEKRKRMSENKTNKKELIRSSAVEYLTFIAASGESGVNVIYADENIWLSQRMMGELYDVETHTINYHLKKIFSDQELDESSVIRNFRITASDGKTYNTQHYNLSATDLKHEVYSGYGKQTLATLSQTLSWSHFIELVTIEDRTKRRFYQEMCLLEYRRWQKVQRHVLLSGYGVSHWFSGKKQARHTVQDLGQSQSKKVYSKRISHGRRTSRGE